MLGDKVKFTCKNCGWQTSIRVEWADLRPKRCMNKKCNKSFHKEPNQLQIDLPPKKEKAAKVAQAKQETATLQELATKKKKKKKS